MDINDRVGRIERRQEDLIAVVGDLTGAVEASQGILVEIAEWLQRPPSSELSDLLRDLVAAVGNLSDRIGDIPNQIVKILKEPDAQ